jgi:hypothetical protein
MLRAERNLEYSFICGPLINFLLMEMILWHAHQFEFDMPVVDNRAVISNRGAAKRCQGCQQIWN